MHFIRSIVSAIFLVATLEGMACMESESPVQVLHFEPEPQTYSMHVREFHECVSCNSDDGARKDFLACLKNLSDKNQNLAKVCCKSIYDEQFCKKAYNGNIDFSLVCVNPMKGLEVERCFWKSTDKSTNDIAEFRQCKLKILERFCTTKSGD